MRSFGDEDAEDDEETEEADDGGVIDDDEMLNFTFEEEEEGDGYLLITKLLFSRSLKLWVFVEDDEDSSSFNLNFFLFSI